MITARSALVALGVVVLLGGGWMFRWQYDHVSVGGATLYVRTNRLTGNVQVLTRHGWSERGDHTRTVAMSPGAFATSVPVSDQPDTADCRQPRKPYVGRYADILERLRAANCDGVTGR